MEEEEEEGVGRGIRGQGRVADRRFSDFGCSEDLTRGDH